MSGYTQQDLDHLFAYHPPANDMQRERYERVRAAGKALATVILAEAPSCADQTVALRAVREAVMWANAAIACNGDQLTPPSS